MRTECSIVVGSATSRTKDGKNNWQPVGWSLDVFDSYLPCPCDDLSKEIPKMRLAHSGCWVIERLLTLPMLQRRPHTHSQVVTLWGCQMKPSPRLRRLESKEMNPATTISLALLNSQEAVSLFHSWFAFFQRTFSCTTCLQLWSVMMTQLERKPSCSLTTSEVS